MRHRIVFAGAILTFALSSIGPTAAEQAQGTGASAPEITSQEAPVTFSSKVNLVQVPVVVRDAQGRVVGNLKKEDFQLFDKGNFSWSRSFTSKKQTRRTRRKRRLSSPRRPMLPPLPRAPRCRIATSPMRSMTSI